MASDGMATAKTKRSSALEFLFKELREGKYKPGAKFVSENELLKRLDLSRNTLREALMTLVCDGYLKRVQGSGTYVTGKLLREMRRPARQKTVALIASNPHEKGEADPFIGAVLGGVHAALDKSDWNVKLLLTDSMGSSTASLCESIVKESSADAVIFAGMNVDMENAGPLLRNKIPCVSIGMPEDEKIPYVDSDNRQGMRDTIAHLLRLGHRRIALADRANHRKSYESRRQGYCDAFRDAGLEPDLSLAIDFNGWDAKAGEEAAAKLLAASQGVTAAVVYGDWATFGFLRELERRSIRVPEEISLVSFASFDWLSQACGMDVAHVANPLRELGRLAASVASGSESKATEARRLPFVLVQGKSIARPK